MRGSANEEIWSACTCFAVRRAARHVTQAYDRWLAPTGLRTTQFSLLNRLARGGPRSIQRLAAEMGMDRTTLGRNLRPLEREGYVSIAVDPEDRRGRALQITPAGEAKRQEAKRYWAEAQAKFEQAYGREKIGALHTVLADVAGLELGRPGADAAE